MKVHDLVDGVLVEKQVIEMTDENYALATNNLDKIAFGGIDKKVHLQSVALTADHQLQFEGELQLAMQFDSAVTKVEFVGAKHLLAVSEDAAVQIMDLETGKVQSYVKGSHQGSVRNAAVDPLLDFLATVGCDGNLHIHCIEDQTLKRRQLVSTGNTLNYSPQTFALKWSEEGSLLFAAGNTNLTVLTRQATTEEHVLEKISHEKAISLIELPSQDVLITVGLDKVLKVWNIRTEPKCTHSCTL